MKYFSGAQAGQHRAIRQRHFPEKKNYQIIVLSLSEELEFPCTIVYNTKKWLKLQLFAAFEVAMDENSYEEVFKKALSNSACFCTLLHNVHRLRRSNEQR